MTADHLLDRLNTNGLPVLAPGAPCLLEVLSSADNDLQRVLEVVERFPSVTMRLIGLANSGWSSPASPIDSLARACARLGLDIVRTVSIALTVAAPFDLRRCPGFDRERYWMHAMLTASSARIFAALSAKELAVDPQTAHTAGLLHNIGLVWLASQMPREVDTALTMKQAEPGCSIGNLLRERLGIDHILAGAHLGRAWSLPETILVSMTSESAGGEDPAAPILAVVRSAAAVASMLLEGENGLRQAVRQQRLQDGGMAQYFDMACDQLSDPVSDIRALAHELFAQ